MGSPYYVIEWQLTSGLKGRARLLLHDHGFATVLGHACMLGITMEFPEITAMTRVLITEVTITSRPLDVTTFGSTSTQYMPGLLEADIEFEEA